MTTTRKKTTDRLGDEIWFVEWTYELAWVDGDSASEFREVDRDNCKTRIRRVATKEEAEKLAREVYPQTTDCFGFVEYWHAQYTAYDDEDGKGPYCHRWEPSAEWPETYEGED